MTDYFVIHNSDGDTLVTPLSKKELEERLNNNYWGSVLFLDEIPVHNDTNYWGENVVLIIKGSVVMPKPEAVVLQYKVE